MADIEAPCTRCGGKGRGDWVVQHGICYGCWGKGTRAAQIARTAKIAADERHAREVETVSILINAPTRHDAQIAYFEAFVGDDRADWGGSPLTTQLHDGWFVISVRMHVASVLGRP